MAHFLGNEHYMPTLRGALDLFVTQIWKKKSLERFLVKIINSLFPVLAKMTVGFGLKNTLSCILYTKNRYLVRHFSKSVLRYLRTLIKGAYIQTYEHSVKPLFGLEEPKNKCVKQKLKIEWLYNH